MRLLIIEDNIDSLISMKKILEKENFCVDIADNGIEGEEKAYINNYDLILLDLRLKDKDGKDIIKYLREENISSPIIVISAHQEVRESLDLGADDYICKPFDFEVLIARINAVIRRSYGKSTPKINIGNLAIDTKLKKVTFENKKIELTSKEYSIFEHLALNHPRIVSSEEIQEHIYDEHFDLFSSVLRVHITKLRKKLKSITGTDILINIRGKGYSLREINF